VQWSAAGLPGKCRSRWSRAAERDRLNVHGAIDLETGQTVMKDVLVVDAVSTIMLLMAIEAMYPGKRVIHVFLDNARYHHAKLVQAWLAEPDRRIKLHFIPTYCPHLNPIERLWGLMHKHITHNCESAPKWDPTALWDCRKFGGAGQLRPIYEEGFPGIPPFLWMEPRDGPVAPPNLRQSQIRACRQLSQITLAARYTAARKFRAVLS
jgi:DDE superfamily endonuclease